MVINNPVVTGHVEEIKPFIYAVVVKDNYDRSMLFCRYQEFYESPFPEIRRQFFTLEYYMKLYRERNKKFVFTYPVDWSGYNIPSNIIHEAKKTFRKTETDYDRVMNEIITYCDRESEIKNDGIPHPWYLIGADKIKSSTMNHEIAHGLYYTNLNYKVEMDYLVSHIKPAHYNQLKTQLIKTGYVDDKKIIDDEIQAFMSTGKLHSWSDSTYNLYGKEFRKVFKKFYTNK
jgi:hypothetical protein